MVEEKQVAKFVGAIGFTEYDGKVKAALYRIAKRLVFNMITNARYVSEACNCKIIKTSHFKAVDQLMRKMIVQGTRAQTGGADVHLPTEWFGGVSGSYHPIDAVRTFETQSFSDPSVTRVGHDVFNGQIGGALKSKKGASLINADAVDAMVADYNKRKNMKTPVRISKSANALVRLSVHQNLSDILKHISQSTKSKKLQGDLIVKTASSHSQYAHMA